VAKVAVVAAKPVVAVVRQLAAIQTLAVTPAKMVT
jgi:hypothetical protein